LAFAAQWLSLIEEPFAAQTLASKVSQPLSRNEGLATPDQHSGGDPAPIDQQHVPVDKV